MWRLSRSLLTAGLVAGALPIASATGEVRNYWSTVAPETDRPIVDYQRFLKIGPFLMQEDLARHVKRCFAKDIVVVRYCMSAFGGTYFSAYDITPFANSDAVDIIVAQPSYNRRGAGMAFGERLPAASFRRHGKFLVNEFDFRTYGAYTHWETELAAINHGRAGRCAGQHERKLHLPACRAQRALRLPAAVRLRGHGPSVRTARADERKGAAARTEGRRLALVWTEGGTL